VSKDFMQLLSGMTAEVDEFHPFLNDLFKRLGHVDHVHYTHGPNEVGADFILYRTDPSLEQRDVIGVVAKLGAIRIDHADVNRQVEECFIPRLSPDGREQIQMNEVWVAATGAISENAKLKIQDKYKGRKITFLKGEKLAELAFKHMPDYGEAVPIAIGEYRNQVLGVLREVEGRSALVPGLEIPYQFPDVQECKVDRGGLLKPVATFASIEQLYPELMRREFTLIESGMGGGKSRLLREIVRRSLDEPAFLDGHVIPIFVTCQELRDKYQYNLDKLIAERTTSLSLDLSPAFLLAIDGFDELHEEIERKIEIVDAIAAWANQSTGRHVVLTTRPSEKLQTSSGIIRNLLVMRIRPLRGKKALALFAAVGGGQELSTRIQKDLTNSPLLKSLDASPISYTLLALILKENDQQIPASVPELFNKYFELILGRWEIDKGLRRQIEYSMMHACLSELSYALLDNGRSEMGMAEAKRIIVDYAVQRGLVIDAATFIHGLSERSHVLFVDNKNETVGFRHRAFCEFFYAFKLKGGQSHDITSTAFHPYWVGTYYFLSGLLKDCPELITSLTNAPLDNELKRFMKIVNFGHVLQAAYMTPRRHITEAVKQVCLDAATLYREIRDNPDNELSNLTTMQLLGVFRTVMVDVYGYSVFEKPLADAICDLTSESHSESHALAVLFASLAHNEADGRVNFDDLIEGFGDKLPLEIKLVVRSESAKLSHISEKLKKFNRNLVKSIRGNMIGVRVAAIDQLFKSPIKTLAFTR